MPGGGGHAEVMEQVTAAAPNPEAVVVVVAEGSGGGPTHEDCEIRRQTDASPNFGSMPFASLSAWWAELDKPRAMSLLVLVFVNLINYMDRSTVAGMMDSIRKDASFHIESDKYLGLLQTAFVICYMIFAPLFGYLGDRFNRKSILMFGLALWSAATLVGSFMKNFWWFLSLRAFVGIGEASYSTIAPAIISDLYSKDQRSRALAIFYFAIPVGTGLGYIVGSEVAENASDWRWGLRVTPFIGVVALAAVFFFMLEPDRGASEGNSLRPSTFKEDLLALKRNTSFVFATLAFTCVAFSAGSLMWWGPQFAYYGAKAECGAKAGCENISQAGISRNFGFVMTFAGLIGVPAGSYISQTIRRTIPNADPIVSGVTLLFSVPVLFAGFLVARHSVNQCLLLTFIAGLLLNCNWSIVSDMTMYIVVASRRSFASAIQILVSHALGDAFSPFLVGVLSDWIRPALLPRDNDVPVVTVSTNVIPYSATIFIDDVDRDFTPQEYDIEFRSLQYALFTSCFFQVFGGFFFLWTSFYVLQDKARAEEETRLQEESQHQVGDGVARVVRVGLGEAASDTEPIVRNAEEYHTEGEI